ncbi:hypothetical protein CYLTODRAFT_427232 [Cylindrobasidium torrendii FP15055 ss-10]|uniref:GRAM domain-containing protein n=1 Tax=Cylindrobasidium torrendii FP15055 ss-10 TaxID=1314674 RepID=A0A0D7AUW3_9AGAR|nr:hypothetical protein CYLTODRAFT_427232 [Cylindrobasidium torrendii FP15055 ss-10]
MLDGQRNPIPLPHEMTVMAVDSGADLALRIPEVGKITKTLKASGRLWITDQRFLFAAAVPDSPFETLSIPLPFILSTKFEQPTFGSNYVALEIQPSSGGGLTEGSQLEVRIKDQAMFQFVALLEKTRERAIYMRREALQEDGPPMYDSPTGSSMHLEGAVANPSTPSSRNAPGPSDLPPAYDA